MPDETVVRGGVSVDHPPDPTPADLHLRVLDTFCLEREGVPVVLSGVGQRVLAYLAVLGPTHRCVLAGRLWPESAESNARANLRTTLWLVTHRAAGAVQARADMIDLGPRVDVDLHRFHRMARRILDDQDEIPLGIDDVLAALRELRGLDLLPGWYDDWLGEERELVRQLRMHALEALSAALLRRGRPAAALEVALNAVQMEPLRETANAAVIAAHLHEQNVIEALRHYESFRRRLWDDLGVRPSEDLRRALPATARHPGHRRRREG